MLKLTYTETAFRMERLHIPIETWMAQRVTLTLHAGQKLMIEPSQASFLLPAQDPRLTHLEHLLRSESGAMVSMIFVDEDYVEVNFPGTWVAESADMHEGLLVSRLPDEVEICVYKLWYAAQSPAFFLS